MMRKLILTLLLADGGSAATGAGPRQALAATASAPSRATERPASRTSRRARAPSGTSATPRRARTAAARRAPASAASVRKHASRARSGSIASSAIARRCDRHRRSPAASRSSRAARVARWFDASSAAAERATCGSIGAAIRWRDRRGRIAPRAQRRAVIVARLRDRDGDHGTRRPLVSGDRRRHRTAGRATGAATTATTGAAIATATARCSGSAATTIRMAGYRRFSIGFSLWPSYYRLELLAERPVDVSPAAGLRAVSLGALL